MAYSDAVTVPAAETTAADPEPASRPPAVVRWAIITAVVITVAAVVLDWLDVGLLKRLTVEDGVVENLQALGYFGAAACFAVLTFRRPVHRWVPAGHALFFFLVAGEEISWGQRIFGFQSDPIAAHNVQGETNLHNIDGVHQVQRLAGLAVVLGVALAVPLAVRWSGGVRRLVQRLRWPVSPLALAVVFLLGVGVMIVPRVLGEGAVFHIDEVGELLLAMAFFVFSAVALGQSRSQVGSRFSR